MVLLLLMPHRLGWIRDAMQSAYLKRPPGSRQRLQGTGSASPQTRLGVPASWLQLLAVLPGLLRPAQVATHGSMDSYMLMTSPCIDRGSAGPCLSGNMDPSSAARLPMIEHAVPYTPCNTCSGAKCEPRLAELMMAVRQQQVPCPG